MVLNSDLSISISCGTISDVDTSPGLRFPRDLLLKLNKFQSDDTDKLSKNLHCSLTRTT